MGEGKRPSEGGMVSAQRARACSLRETEGHEKEGCLACTVVRSSHVKPFQQLIWTLDHEPDAGHCGTCRETDEMVLEDWTLSEVPPYGLWTLGRPRNRILKKPKG